MLRDLPPQTALEAEARVHAAGSSVWAGALVAAVTVLLLLALYASTVGTMIAIWRQSDTFAHGFVVAPLVAFLIWRNRASLALAESRPAWRWLPLVAVAALAWFVGELAQVNALRQFALVGLMVLAVIVIAGEDFARRIAFPLGFLFFAVPFGEFLLPVLMDWTARVTVFGLRASGIPVFVEGLQFVIPSGYWSVVEACSGVRYLIASVMVGTLFAYLTYVSPKRRLAFVGVSILVPIVANWMRAYLIVMLGHLSSNRLAVGVDHLVYGWIFFGFVMLLMFWIGTKWREDEPIGHEAAVRWPGPALRPTTTPIAVTLAAAAAFVAMASLPLAAAHLIGTAQRVGAVTLATPGAPAGWQLAPAAVTDWRPRYVQPSAERFATFAQGSDRVGVYLAFYRNQTSERKLISFVNMLVMSDDQRWSRMHDEHRPVNVAGETLTVRVTDLRGRGDERLRLWQWFWVDGHFTGSDVVAKLYTLRARLLGHGDDSATVILVTPVGDNAVAADDVLQAFVRDGSSAIASTLAAAREAP